MLSEAELHVLRLRMDAGRQRQIERGSYRQHLPTGLIRLEDGRVVKDPDLQVQRTIELIFARFATLGSCQKVMRSLRDDALLLPRRQRGGLHAGQLLWRKPTQAALAEMLHNPAYAGAFVYGRSGPAPDGRPGHTRRVDRPIEEWTVIHQGVYPAYISWEQFMANQARLADNASTFARRARGAPRDGTALLAGLVVCGRCGYQLRVAYKPQRRYTCTALAAAYGAATCLHVDGASLEAAVVEAFFAALAPAELDLLEEVVAAQQADHARLAQHYADQVTRAEYEARLAQRQYQAVDPDNRLVAAELERRWELALRAVAKLAKQLSALPLSQRFRRSRHAYGAAARPRTASAELWASGQLTPAHQKELLRSLIRRVIVTRPVPDRVEARVVWVSGAVTPLTVHPPILRAAEMSSYEEFVARVLTLGAEGYQDREIAERLSAEGFRTAEQSNFVGIRGEYSAGTGPDLADGAVQDRGEDRRPMDGVWVGAGVGRASQLAVRAHSDRDTSGDTSSGDRALSDPG